MDSDEDQIESMVALNQDSKPSCFASRTNDVSPYLLYPEDPIKSYWDIFIMIVLIFACLVQPCRLAFVEVEPPNWIRIYFAVDIMFLVDICQIFNSAYYDENFNLVQERKVIAKNYLGSWFLVDVIAIIPFDLFMGSSNNFNEIARITRIGRMYKLVKLTRMFKVFKFMKEKNKMFKYLQ
jgi:hypothetical protein